MGGEATIFNSLVLAAVHEERRMILGQRLGVIHTSECVDGIGFKGIILSRACGRR